MIPREKAIERLDTWRQAFGGVEVTLIQVNPTRVGGRAPSIDFMLGPRGFSWVELGGDEQAHFAKADRILYDEAFEVLSIDDLSKGWHIEMQPLRTPEIVDAVRRWKEDHPNRVDVTRNLRELAG
jgi:hypothetical protein